MLLVPLDNIIQLDQFRNNMQTFSCVNVCVGKVYSSKSFENFSTTVGMDTRVLIRCIHKEMLIIKSSYLIFGEFSLAVERYQ